MAKVFEKDPDGDLQETEIPVGPQLESEIEYERQIERLDSFFATLQPGVTLLIERIKPSWCSGLLEEITVGDEAVNLDYFIDTWGGQVLSVKVRDKRGRLGGKYKIPLHSYPPLRFGELIEQFNKGDRFREQEYQPNPSPVVVHQPAPSASTDKIIASLAGLAPFFLEYMKNQEARRQNDMMMMMQMMKANNGGGGGGIADFGKMAAVMQQLNQIFRENQGGGDNGGGDMDFLPQALDVLKMVLSPGAAQSQPKQPKSRLSAGVPSGAPPARRMSAAPGPMSQPAPVAKVMPLPTKDIAGTISQMEPKEAAGTLIDAIGRMNPDKRNEAIGHFLTEFQNDMGDELEDEDFEDEPAETDDKRGMRQ